MKRETWICDACRKEKQPDELMKLKIPITDEKLRMMPHKMDICIKCAARICAEYYKIANENNSSGIRYFNMADEENEDG